MEKSAMVVIQLLIGSNVVDRNGSLRSVFLQSQEHVEDRSASILHTDLPFRRFLSDLGHESRKSTTAGARARLELVPWQCFASTGMTLKAPVWEPPSHLALHTAKPRFGSSGRTM
ncbi:hypothetical protein M3J09_009466 [Ascochyta lentis]